jgi:hypothetical protein
LGIPGTVEAKASLGRQVLEPEEWPSSSLMGDIDAPIDDAVDVGGLLLCPANEIMRRKAFQKKTVLREFLS